MKKLIVVLSAVLALTIFSCKKKEKDPEPTTPTTNTPVPNNYDGLLYSQEISFVSSGTIMTTSGNSNAIFPTGGFYNSSTISDGFIGTALNVGTVSLNTVSLKPDNQSSGTFYTDTTYAVFSAPLPWSVSGGNGIPAFTYTYTDVRPTYTGWNALQDTIKLSQNTVINLTGIIGADEILIYVMSGSGMTSKVVSGTVTSANFSTSDLSSLSASTSASIWIQCSKYSFVGVAGKNFKFKTSYSIIKSIVTQ